MWQYSGSLCVPFLSSSLHIIIYYWVDCNSFWWKAIRNYYLYWIGGNLLVSPSLNTPNTCWKIDELISHHFDPTINNIQFPFVFNIINVSAGSLSWMIMKKWRMIRILNIHNSFHMIVPSIFRLESLWLFEKRPLKIGRAD